MKFLKLIDKYLENLSSWILVFSVFAMLTMSVLNIVLRWMDTTIHWVEPFVRHLVFLSTFLGGVLATGRGTHIGIDILGKWCESNKKLVMHRWITRIIALTSLLTLLWLVKASVDFVNVELEFGKPVFWGISSGVLVGIIPFGFIMIAYRFFVILLNSFFTPDEHGQNSSQTAAGG
jgi:TRAP-type C4-dicarboxylate transport system permease small subunit